MKGNVQMDYYALLSSGISPHPDLCSSISPHPALSSRRGLWTGNVCVLSQNTSPCPLLEERVVDE